MRDRDKFLTEVMGRTWHEFSHEREAPCGIYRVCVCGRENYIFPCNNISFSTWRGFGPLWEWAVDQEWFFIFLNGTKLSTIGYGKRGNYVINDLSIIHPNRFATAIYDYLKQEADKP